MPYDMQNFTVFLNFKQLIRVIKNTDKIESKEYNFVFISYNENKYFMQVAYD